MTVQYLVDDNSLTNLILTARNHSDCNLHCEHRSDRACALKTAHRRTNHDISRPSRARGSCPLPIQLAGLCIESGRDLQRVRNRECVESRDRFSLCAAPSCPRQLRSDAFERVGLDDVAFFEVLELGDLNAALEAFGHFAHVVFESPQAFDLTVEDEQVLSEHVDEVSCRWCGSGAGTGCCAGTGD